MCVSRNVYTIEKLSRMLFDPFSDNDLNTGDAEFIPIEQLFKGLIVVDSVPEVIQNIIRSNNYQHAIERKDELFTYITHLPENNLQQITTKLKAIRLALNPQCRLGWVFSQQRGIFNCSDEFGNLNKLHLQLERLLKLEKKFFHLSAEEMFFGLTDARSPKEIRQKLALDNSKWAVDNKEIIFEYIKSLPANNLRQIQYKIKVLQRAMDPKYRLGEIFWRSRGELDCSLQRGTLKKLNDELKRVKRLELFLMPTVGVNSTMGYFANRDEARLPKAVDIDEELINENMFKL